MKPTTGTHRLTGLDRLMAAIHAEMEASGRVPCVDPVHGHLWLSDNHADQQTAVHGCLTCPVLDACTAYVTVWPEPAGIWAGVPRRNIQRKEHP